MGDFICFEIDVDPDDDTYCGQKCPGNGFGKKAFCKYCNEDLMDAGSTVCEKCDSQIPRYFRCDTCLDNWHDIKE